MSSAISPYSDEEKQLISVEKELSHVNKEIKRLTERRNWLIKLKDKLQDEILLKKSNTHCTDDWNKDGVPKANITNQFLNCENIGSGDHGFITHIYKNKNLMASCHNSDVSKFTTRNSCKNNDNQLSNNRTVLSQTIANDIVNALKNGLKEQSNLSDVYVDKDFGEEVKILNVHFSSETKKSNLDVPLTCKKSQSCFQEKEILEKSKTNMVDFKQNKASSLESSSLDLMKINEEFKRLRENYGNKAKTSYPAQNRNKISLIERKEPSMSIIIDRNAECLLNTDKQHSFLNKLEYNESNDYLSKQPYERKYLTYEKNKANEEKRKNHLVPTVRTKDDVDEQKVLYCIFDRRNEMKNDDSSSWEDFEDDLDNNNIIKNQLDIKISENGMKSGMHSENSRLTKKCGRIEIKDESSKRKNKFYNKKEINNKTRKNDKYSDKSCKAENMKSSQIFVRNTIELNKIKSKNFPFATKGSNERIIQWLNNGDEKEQNNKSFRPISETCEILFSPAVVKTKRTNIKAESSTLKNVNDTQQVTKKWNDHTARLFSIESLQALRNVLDSTSEVTLSDNFLLKDETGGDVNCVLALEKKERNHRLNHTFQAESIPKLQDMCHKDATKNIMNRTTQTVDRKESDENQYTLLSFVKSPSVEARAFADQNSVLRMNKDSNPAATEVPQCVYPNQTELLQSINKYISDGQSKDSPTLARAQDQFTRARCRRRRNFNTSLKKRSSTSVFHRTPAYLSTCSTNNQSLCELENKLLRKYLSRKSLKSILSSDLKLDMPNKSTNFINNKISVPTTKVTPKFLGQKTSKVFELMYRNPSVNLLLNKGDSIWPKDNRNLSKAKCSEEEGAKLKLMKSKKNIPEENTIEDCKCTKLLCQGAGDFICTNLPKDFHGKNSPHNGTTMLRLNQNTAIDLKDNSGYLKMLNARNCSSALRSNGLSTRRRYELLLMDRFKYEESLIDEKYRRVLEKRQNRKSNHHWVSIDQDITNNHDLANYFDGSRKLIDVTKAGIIADNRDTQIHSKLIIDGNVTNALRKDLDITSHGDMTNDGFSTNYGNKSVRIPTNYEHKINGRKLTRYSDIKKDCNIINNQEIVKQEIELTVDDKLTNKFELIDHNKINDRELKNNVITKDREVSKHVHFIDERNFKSIPVKSCKCKIAVFHNLSDVKEKNLDKFHTDLGPIKTVPGDFDGKPTMTNKENGKLDERFEEVNGDPKADESKHLKSEKSDHLLTQPCCKELKSYPNTRTGNVCDILTNNEIDGHFKEQIKEYTSKINSILKKETVSTKDEHSPELQSNFKVVFDHIKELQLRNSSSSHPLDNRSLSKKIHREKSTFSEQSHQKTFIRNSKDLYFNKGKVENISSKVNVDICKFKEFHLRYYNLHNGLQNGESFAKKYSTLLKTVQRTNKVYEKVGNLIQQKNDNAHKTTSESQKNTNRSDISNMQCKLTFCNSLEKSKNESSFKILTENFDTKKSEISVIKKISVGKTISSDNIKKIMSANCKFENINSNKNVLLRSKSYHKTLKKNISKKLYFNKDHVANIPSKINIEKYEFRKTDLLNSNHQIGESFTRKNSALLKTVHKTSRENNDEKVGNLIQKNDNEKNVYISGPNIQSTMASCNILAKSKNGNHFKISTDNNAEIKKSFGKSANYKEKNATPNKDAPLKTIRRFMTDSRRRINQQIRLCTSKNNTKNNKNECNEMKSRENIMETFQNKNKAQITRRRKTRITRRVTKMFGKTKRTTLLVDSKKCEENVRTEDKKHETNTELGQGSKDQPNGHCKKSLARRVTIMFSKNRKTSGKLSGLQGKLKPKDADMKKKYAFSPSQIGRKRKRISFWKTEKKVGKCVGKK